MNSKDSLIASKELFRLWYEFYRLALVSEDPKVVKALKQSKKRYADWGSDTSLKFDEWWKTHKYLFVDLDKVRLLEASEERDPDHLYVRVPKGKSHSDLVEEFRALIVAEIPESPKRRKVPPAHRFAPTEIQGVKRENVRMMLELQRRVFSKSDLKGFKLTKRVIEFFQSERYVKKQNIVPHTFRIDLNAKHYDHADEADRNVRRYRQKCQKLLLNVANGEFPGKY